MKSSVSKAEAMDWIKRFFGKEKFTPEEMRKVKRLAMRFNICLGTNRRKFCRDCLFPLAGKTRISRTHKTIVCGRCGSVHRFRINLLAVK